MRVPTVRVDASHSDATNSFVGTRPGVRCTSRDDPGEKGDIELSRHEASVRVGAVSMSGLIWDFLGDRARGKDEKRPSNFRRQLRRWEIATEIKKDSSDLRCRRASL